jgi:aspartyl-tRNA(Asn)/glutamyl-tRNA(Gln) amidotransferase subunit A
MWDTILQESLDTYARFLNERNATVGAFLEIGTPEQMNDRSIEYAPGSVPVAVKDNIAVKGYRLTCGSRMLEEVRSPYDATAVERLRGAGAAIVGKTNLDEFGMGSSTEHSALAETKNPWNPDLVAGGSSGGSAVAVAHRLVPVALGSDTGGSVRQPAAFCGVYGLKPTYGTIPRDGLVAYASSLETIGIIAESTDHVAETYRTLRGLGSRDHSSVSVPDKSKESGPSGGRATIGVLDGDLGLSDSVRRNFQDTAERLRGMGYGIKPVMLKTEEYISAAYYTIATAEAAANLARYNGIRYGYRPVFAENPEELMRKARSEGFGEEVKLRIVLGTYVLRSGFQDQYYNRAQKIRTLIRRELDEIFRSVDALLLPTFPVQAFRKGDAGMDDFQQKVADRFTGIANLTGIPALTVPSGIEGGLPVGMQIMGPSFSEERLFSVAKRLAEDVPIRFPESSVSFVDWSAG